MISSSVLHPQQPRDCPERAARVALARPCVLCVGDGGDECARSAQGGPALRVRVHAAAAHHRLHCLGGEDVHARLGDPRRGAGAHTHTGAAFFLALSHSSPLSLTHTLTHPQKEKE
eukprot:6181022-Pleurochrysis_carterae.AAC.3